ncbi:enoyl-CoA hydratase-related protein [Acinetobacter baumannii]
MGYIKHALNHSFDNNLEEQLALEDTYQQKSAATQDFTEGVNAFLEKRQPNFKGE